MHAVVALPGFTALTIREYAPETTVQPHLGLGLRFSGFRKDSWWGFEASISGDGLAGPLVYNPGAPRAVTVRGPWLHAEAGMRVRLESESRWTPTFNIGLGAQAHLRRRTGGAEFGMAESSLAMEDGVVLALGMGLQYRTRSVLLGLDFQMRGGGPDEYRSITALWNVGFPLDQGE